MEEQKAWYMSKTIIASLVTLVALVAGVFNVTIDTDSQQSIIELVSVVVGAIGSAVAIYGRIKANKTIK